MNRNDIIPEHKFRFFHNSTVYNAVEYKGETPSACNQCDFNSDEQKCYSAPHCWHESRADGKTVYFKAEK